MNSSMRMSISITIPAYNEEETVAVVCKEAVDELKKLTNLGEVLLVDDGSTDKTGKIMNDLKTRYGRKIRVIHHKKNLGFSGAMNTCYKEAKGDLIFLGPADGQFDYSQVKSFVEELLTNNRDIVVGYRSKSVENIARRFISFGFRILSRMLFGIKLKEFSRCVLYTRGVRDSITVYADPRSCLFLLEFVYKSVKKGYNFGQVPMIFEKRKGGEAKGGEIGIILATLFAVLTFWLQIRTRKNI